MIVVEGWIRFATGKLDSARDAARTLVEATRREPGCISYALSEDLAEPDLLRIAEIWESEEAMQAHAKAPHVAAFAAHLGGGNARGMSIKAYSGATARTVMEG